MGVITEHGTFREGDKVYSRNGANFGVGYIKKIKLTGVHTGFQAKIESNILNKPKWYDARNIQKKFPERYEHYKQD